MESMYIRGDHRTTVGSGGLGFFRVGQSIENLGRVRVEGLSPKRPETEKRES